MHDSAIAFITHPLPARQQPVHRSQGQPSNRITLGKAFKSIHAFAECTVRLGDGGNCRSLREHYSPVVNQALQSMRCHIQCGVIHRAFIAGTGFGVFPF
jgi:hypothetical protein